MMMTNILRNEKGTSLIEVISVVLMSTILIAVSAVGVIAFFKSYNSIDSYVPCNRVLWRLFT
jgi:Tfp pilus assembly protein PilV